MNMRLNEDETFVKEMKAKLVANGGFCWKKSGQVG